MAVTEHTTRIATVLQVGGIEVSYQSAMTMQGLEMIASYLAAPYSHTLPFAPFIAIGQSENATSTERRQLERELFRKFAVSEDGGVRYGLSVRFFAHEPSDAYILREVGVFDQLAGGHMIVRFVLDTDINVAVLDELEIFVYFYPEKTDSTIPEELA